ncbi:CobW family GTP-binding protein [Pseudomonas sp. LRF_L74]|uniref:CobW family GTP-binding protein n=1 Tax=Pseudomonas sp. LRF_L74 TaxID=3369422 RepID=UPI003F60B587
MLKNIPTHVIAGPLGAGKTTLIRELLGQKPEAERWAVLVNEFGQVGLDAALLTTDSDGVTLSEVAGGCLCCVNGAPFQVGLGRLLRMARPDRLFIEPSGLGHPRELLAQLRDEPWRGVLDVQAPVMVLDAQALAAGNALPAAQGDLLDEAGLLVLNKSDELDDKARAGLVRLLPAVKIRWASHGHVLFTDLPGHERRAAATDAAFSVPDGQPPLPSIWPDPTRAACQVSDSADGWSIGWRWHPGQRFDLGAVEACLANWPWRRAKLVLHGEAGWRSANLLPGQALQWKASEWRKDSRLELIFAQAQDRAALAEAVAACRLE